MEREGVEEVRLRTGGGLHSGEQYLIRALGEEIGGRLHLARSSGDLSSVGINTLQRDGLVEIMDALNRLRRLLVDLARGHTAHQIVGILVRICEERELGPAEVTPALVDEASTLYHGRPAGLAAAAIASALDPGRFIAARTLPGGPAPSESLRQAHLLEAAVRADERTVAEIRGRIEGAARRLEEAIDRIIGA